MQTFPVRLLTVLLWISCRLSHVAGFSSSSPTNAAAAAAAAETRSPMDQQDPIAEKVQVTLPLDKIRPEPTSAMDRFWRLWNDKRSFVDLVRDSNAENTDNGSGLPYCLVSDQFQVANLTFQVLLYPRGVYSSASSSSSSSLLTNVDDRKRSASAYLSFWPNQRGQEADVAWKLKLVSKTNGKEKVLPVETSGGLPKSNTTWSAAMTFCSPAQAVDSLGRTADWGSSIWKAADVVNCIQNVDSCLYAQIEMTVFRVRNEDSATFWPPALVASQRAATESPNPAMFRAGHVITAVPDSDQCRRELEGYGIYAGVDYRIMTIADDKGDEIFATEALPSIQQQTQASVALRPVGWKLQQQMWQKRGWKNWPVQVPVSLLASVTYSRFHPKASLPRLWAFFVIDVKSVILALTLALAPIPVALITREFFSFYAIPSASMDPTLAKGDVLLVEKLPLIYSRLHRGDIVLFRPPTALETTIQQAGGKISKNQLFVKRLVGLPGDENIVMQQESQQVSIGGLPAVGPPRNLCDDEPLRLIDTFLKNGQGTNIDRLGEDETYVLGDCQAVSVDSRVFGTLPKDNIVGKPVARIWPLTRFTLGSPP